jgi:type IV secretion system protein VirD4
VFFGAGARALHPWLWVGAPSVVSPSLFWTVAAGLLVALVLAPPAGGRLAAALAGEANLLPPLTRWAQPWEIRRLVTRRAPGRVSLGRRGRLRLAAEPGESVLVVGPTQSGKSSCICIPAILEWQGAVVAISVKRDLVDRTAGWRQRQGRVHIYDPSRATNMPGMTWSPHAGCETFELAWRMAGWMSESIDKRGDGEWAHWRDAGHRLLAVALYAGRRLERPMGDVRSWVDDAGGEELRRALESVRGCAPEARQVLSSILERPAKERGSCFSVTQRLLSVFLERSVAESASGSEFEPRTFLLSGQHTLYLVAPIQDQRRLSSLFMGLIMSIVNEAAALAQASPEGRLQQRLLLVLDECANTAPIEQLPQYLSTGHSQGISVVAIFQDYAQIRGRYGDLADSVTNNSRAKLFLSGIADPKTLEVAGQLVGQENYLEGTRGVSGSQSNSSWTWRQRPLLPPDRLRQLRPGAALLLYRHLRPAVIELRPWYRSRRLRRRARLSFVPGATRVLP